LSAKADYVNNRATLSKIRKAFLDGEERESSLLPFPEQSSSIHSRFEEEENMLTKRVVCCGLVLMLVAVLAAVPAAAADKSDLAARRSLGERV